MQCNSLSSINWNQKSFSRGSSTRTSPVSSLAMMKRRSVALALGHSVVAYLEAGTETNLPGDLVVYESIARFPERHDCALLGWRALLEALAS